MSWGAILENETRTGTCESEQAVRNLLVPELGETLGNAEQR